MKRNETMLKIKHEKYRQTKKKELKEYKRKELLKLNHLLIKCTTLSSLNSSY